jgi:hypothetical protein
MWILFRPKNNFKRLVVGCGRVQTSQEEKRSVTYRVIVCCIQCTSENQLDFLCLLKTYCDEFITVTLVLSKRHQQSEVFLQDFSSWEKKRITYDLTRSMPYARNTLTASSPDHPHKHHSFHECVLHSLKGGVIGFLLIGVPSSIRYRRLSGTRKCDFFIADSHLIARA